MNLDNIRKELDDFTKEQGLILFDLTYHNKDDILEVTLDNVMGMEKLEEVSDLLSSFLDKYEKEFPNNYILDVHSVGAERPIRTEDELKNAIGKYIYVETKENEYQGTMLDYTDGIIHMECMDKTRKINVSVDYSKTKKVRYAVKF